MESDFYKDLAASNSPENTQIAYRIMKEVFKSSFLKAVKSPIEWDKKGSDFYMLGKNGDIAHIDMKFRGKKYGDDLVLELDEPNNRPGWLLKEDYLTNYLVWYWADTKEYVVVNYKKLQAVAIEKQDKWREECFDAGGVTKGYGRTPGLVVKYSQIPGFESMSRSGRLQESND